MKFIQGQSRDQITLFPTSLDSSISEENEIRVIDVFVNSIDLVKMGFKHNFIENGRPAYNPKDLMKLYLYGYLNGIRSSRKLEKETKRNIEVIWLLKGLSPDHNTISNFRRDNPKAIKQVFKATVNIAKNLDLIGGLIIAGDGTKIRAQNSKKNNYNQKKIDRHLAYIEKKLSEYVEALEIADGDEKKIIESKIQKQNKHKRKYQEIEKKLIDTGEKQVSTSDPESRHLIVRGVVTEVCYNIQSTVDAKNNIPINYNVTNVNDKNAMTEMVQEAIDIVGNNSFNAVFDKGYYTAHEIYNSQQLGVTTHVCVPNPASNAPDKKYNLSQFIYNKQNDTYKCPAGNTLTSNGNWYKKRTYRVKQYKFQHCKNCEVRTSCSKSKSQRIIERHEFADAIDINKQNIDNNPQIYAQRQAIVEHPFGTIKRQWGFDYIITKKSMERAAADIGLIFTAYNLRRIINILGIKQFVILLKDSLYIFIRIIALSISILSRFKQSLFYQYKYYSFFFFSQNSLI